MAWGDAAAEQYEKDQPSIAKMGRAELDHICCCSPNVALCGAQVTGQDVVLVHPKNGSRPCLACLSKDQRRERCSVPKCPGPDPEGM